MQSKLNVLFSVGAVYKNQLILIFVVVVVGRYLEISFQESTLK